MNQPLLSIFVITYKHEVFIRQTIESLLIQETTFNFEVVVANDCSPDNTSIIIKSIIATHPKGNLIRYFEHKENLGMYNNFMFALNECKGKYIAVCEGDDYWIDPLKLQKQVDFLDANADYEVCFTNVRIVKENDKIKKHALIKEKRRTVYERKDLPIWAPLLTRVFRNRDFSTLPSAPGLDTVMLLWQSQFGKIKYLNEITGAYRKHPGGIYSAQSEVKRKEQIILTDIVCLSLIDSKLYYKYFGMILKKLAQLYKLDKVIFKRNRKIVKNTYIKYRKQIDFRTRHKINVAFVILSNPFLLSLSEAFFLRLFNKLFIYSK